MGLWKGKGDILYKEGVTMYSNFKGLISSINSGGRSSSQGFEKILVQYRLLISYEFDILILICRVEEFCFCSYDFCNSTTKTSSSFSTLAFISLIFQFRICQNSNLLPSTYCLLLFTFGLFSYVTNASCLGYLALASLPFLGAILTNRWWPSVIDPPPSPVTILNKYISGCLIVLS